MKTEQEIKNQIENLKKVLDILEIDGRRLTFDGEALEIRIETLKWVLES